MADERAGTEHTSVGADPARQEEILSFRRSAEAASEWVAGFLERLPELPVLAQVEPGEVLALLGCRPVWDDASRRVVDLEAMSLAELGRPRIDVTVRISGFTGSPSSRIAMPRIFVCSPCPISVPPWFTCTVPSE